MTNLFIGAVLIVLLAPSLSASESDTALAQSLNSSLFNGISTSSVSVVPHYEGTDVEASDLKDEPNLQGYALSNTANIDVANDIKFGHQNRPKVVIDPETDPLFTRIFPEAEVIGSIADATQPGTGETPSCVEVTPTEITNTFIDEKTCSITGIDEYSSYSCTNTWNAYCSNGGQLGEQTLTSPFSLAYLGHSGEYGPNKVVQVAFPSTASRFTIQVRVSASFGNNSVVQNELRGLNQASGGGAKWRHDLTYHSQMMAMCNDPNYEIVSINLTNHNSTWGGAKSALATSANYSGSYSSNELSNPTCENGLTAQLQMSGTGSAGSFQFFRRYGMAPWYDVMSNEWSLTMIYKLKCQVGMSEPVRSCLNENLAIGIADRFITPVVTCNDSANRLIQGISISRDCWEEVTTYNIRQRVYTENPYCETLRSEGCGFNGSTCLTTNDPYADECNYAVQTYVCPRVETTESTQLCDIKLYCPDGICSSELGVEAADLQGFATMATYLSLVQELAEDLSANGAVRVFTGEAQQCSDAALGFANCCKSGGWGIGIGLDSCSANEKILGLNREAQKTRYVGSYCSSDSIFGCLSTKQVHCVYPSKLSRMMVEEGRRQLAVGFGSPSAPNCSGFTIAELESIDFGEADLSDYFSDVMAEHGTLSGAEKTQLMDDILERFNTTNPSLESTL
jgi:hypothetical protein